jgi:hypothetical protein
MTEYEYSSNTATVSTASKSEMMQVRVGFRSFALFEYLHSDELTPPKNNPLAFNATAVSHSKLNSKRLAMPNTSLPTLIPLVQT